MISDENVHKMQFEGFLKKSKKKLNFKTVDGLLNSSQNILVKSSRWPIEKMWWSTSGESLKISKKPCLRHWVFHEKYFSKTRTYGSL